METADWSTRCMWCKWSYTPVHTHTQSRSLVLNIVHMLIITVIVFLKVNMTIINTLTQAYSHYIYCSYRHTGTFGPYGDVWPHHFHGNSNQHASSSHTRRWVHHNCIYRSIKLKSCERLPLTAHLYIHTSVFH